MYNFVAKYLCRLLVFSCILLIPDNWYTGIYCICYVHEDAGLCVPVEAL